MKTSIFNQAVNIARKKLHLHPEMEHFLHYSFIIQGNKVVDWSTNTRKEPPRHYGYHRHDDEGYRPKFHAEIAAYLKAKGIMTNKQFYIINLRLTRQGELRLSRPCAACSKLLSALGCTHFYYSTPESPYFFKEAS